MTTLRKRKDFVSHIQDSKTNCYEYVTHRYKYESKVPFLYGIKISSETISRHTVISRAHSLNVILTLATNWWEFLGQRSSWKHNREKFA